MEVFHAVSYYSPEHLRSLVSDFPTVKHFAVPSDCYWACSMSRAWERARNTDVDFLLWLNDDVFLNEEALSAMLHAWSQWAKPSIVSASLSDPATGVLSYGIAKRASRIWRLRFEDVCPNGRTIVGNVANGNALLIPKSAYEALGGFQSGFNHNLADIDYTLRASKAGFDIISPGVFVGECAENPASAHWKTAQVLGLGERWRLLLEPTGLQPRYWIPFAIRNGGLLGFLYAFQPYVKAAFLSSRDLVQGWFARVKAHGE